MIKVFYGNDRTRIKREIQRWLGTNYETIEGENLTPEDLPNLFRGTSLFDAGKERSILLLDPVGSEAGEFLADYADTPHKVAILEAKPDTKLTGWKKLIKATEMKKFETPEFDTRAMFDVFRVAKRDGKKAVEMLEGMKMNLEAKAFVGVMASQAFKDYEEHAGAREKRVLKELAKLDMDLGAVRTESASNDRVWLLVEGFLTRLKTI